MSVPTVTPYQPRVRRTKDGFAQLLRAEWTKFRTVRGWVIAMAVAALMTVGFGVFSASKGQVSRPDDGLGPAIRVGDRLAAVYLSVVLGLIVVAAVGALFITTEYRRGLIRTTLTASPRRGRVLAAKAIVIGAVAFVVGLAASAILFPIAKQQLREHGWPGTLYPADPELFSSIGLRLVVGSAAIVAITAVLALSVGALARRTAPAVTAVIAMILIPETLVRTLSPDVTAWIQTFTPAAMFSVQHTVPDQAACLAAQACPPVAPLAPWTGLGIGCAYAAIALGLAIVVLRRRDA